MHTVKCVTVADRGVGKTCLLISYTSHSFPDEYIPTTFETLCSNLIIDSKPVRLDLFDTQGHEEYDRLRPLSYSDADVFLICFSVVSFVTYEHVKTKWIKEVRQHCPNAKVLIVGTKIDLRDDPVTVQRMKENKEEVVSHEMGRLLAEEIGKGVPYLECSARTQRGVKEVFEEAVRLVVTPSLTETPTEEGTCVIL